jgi:hypothetical protein
LALATAGFFWQILFAGAWMPAGGGDLAALLYPTYHFAADSLKSGLIPLWNPYLYSGAPFAADIQSSLFYPVNLVYFALTPEVTYRGVMLLAAFHFWLAGAGMYLFLRYLLHRDSIIPPLFGALAFMFSGYFIVHFGNLNLIVYFSLLPPFAVRRTAGVGRVGWRIPGDCCYGGTRPTFAHHHCGIGGRLGVSPGVGPWRVAG